jgi:hypothetical protein
LIYADHFTVDDKKGIDVPFFDMECILAATDNFSGANQLGQGGFGPVYKVNDHAVSYGTGVYSDMLCIDFCSGQVTGRPRNSYKKTFLWFRARLGGIQE